MNKIKKINKIELEDLFLNGLFFRVYVGLKLIGEVVC